MANTTDIGIGSLVFVGTNAPAGPITISLQHKTDNKPLITSHANLLALPLITTEGTPLTYGFFNTTSTATVSSLSFQDISATTSVSVALSGSSVLLSCSINSSAPSGGETGRWKLQYKKSTDTLWIDASYETKRAMSGTDDTGSIVLHALAENLDAEEYDVRLACCSTTGNPIDSFNISLAAVNLAYSDGFEGGSFPSIIEKSLGGNTSSSILSPVAGTTHVFTPESEGNLIAASSFSGIPIGAKRQTGDYDLALTNALTTQTNQHNSRYFSDTADWGSGGSCALFTNLTLSSYTLSARHSTESSTIGSSNVTVVGIFTTSLILDSDQDGMPNDFEYTYFGNATNTAANEDADNDGLNNVEEYIAACNPTDSESVLLGEFTMQSASENISMTWTAQQIRVYDIYWTTNLLTGFSLIHSNITYPQNTYTDLTHSAENTGFYRIEARIP